MNSTTIHFCYMKKKLMKKKKEKKKKDAVLYIKCTMLCLQFFFFRFYYYHWFLDDQKAQKNTTCLKIVLEANASYPIRPYIILSISFFLFSFFFFHCYGACCFICTNTAERSELVIRIFKAMGLICATLLSPVINMRISYGW